MPFVYSDESHAQLTKFITIDRLKSYLAATRGDIGTAIRLYERNTKLSEHLYGVLQACEILFRNSIHITLSQDYGREDWYDAFFLNRREAELIDKAKMSVRKFDNNYVTPGHIVAELTMGFWIRLLAPEYEKSLWVKHLYKAFPCYRKPNRVKIYVRLDEIRRLRNRIAHHEPIFKRDHMKEYANIIEAMGWICPQTAEWASSCSAFPRYAQSLKRMY